MDVYTVMQPFFNDAVAGTVVAVKATQGVLRFMKLVNTTGAAAYLQIFFKPAASVTLGTTVPDWTVRLAASESLPIPDLAGVGLMNGPVIGTGLSIAGTTTPTGLTGAAISVGATFA